MLRRRILRARLVLMGLWRREEGGVACACHMVGVRCHRLYAGRCRHIRHDLGESVRVVLLLCRATCLRAAGKGRIVVAIRGGAVGRRIRLMLSVAGIVTSPVVCAASVVLISSSLTSSAARISATATLPMATSWIASRAIEAPSTVKIAASAATPITASSGRAAPLTRVWLLAGCSLGRRRRRRRKSK